MPVPDPANAEILERFCARLVATARCIAFAAALSLSLGGGALAAPGDILFEDLFDQGGGCRALAPNWTASDANLAGTGTFTSNSGVCAMFTRGGAVSSESIAINLSTVGGANFSAWVRKGDDDFSENPEGANESLVAEYQDAAGVWTEVARFPANGTQNGEVFVMNVVLPPAALHDNARVRFRQIGGSGGPPANGGIGFDFWHVDDVRITETLMSGAVLTANSCDEFENGFGNWTTTNNDRAGVNDDTANTASNSMFIRHGDVTVSSIPVNAPSLTAISFWLQRGDDDFSENPEGGENITFEYLNDAGVWIALETFIGAGAPGEIFVRNFAAPADARHGALQVRFSYPQASGVDFDYWHIDSFCLASGAPSLAISKSVIVESDPVNGAINPFSIPGSFLRYRLTVTNIGSGFVDDGTLSIRDDLDASLTLFVGDLDGAGAPFEFIDGAGANASGVSLNFTGLGDPADGVVFENGGGAPITPAPDFDAGVRTFQLTFTGAMNAAMAGSAPTFAVEYRVRVE